MMRAAAGLLMLLFCAPVFAAETGAAAPAKKPVLKKAAAAPVKKLISKGDASKPAPAPAQAEPKKTDEKKVEKTVTGAAMFVRKNSLAVEFEAGEMGGRDLLLDLDAKVKLKGVKDLKKIQTGDMIRVKYVETFKEPKKKGEDPIVLSRVGTEVTFVSKAPALPVRPPDAMVEGI